MKKERKTKFPKACSPLAIEEYTQKLRNILGLGERPYFNVVSIVENDFAQHLKNFSLEIWSKEKLSGVEAFTAYNPVRIILREDIYEGAYRDETRSRFTLAHELGHLCLHWGFQLPRLAPEAQLPNDPSPKGRVEKEANQFAAAFLMPRSVADKIEDSRRLASLCRVSDEAASYRLHDLWGQNDDFSATDIRKVFGGN